MVKNKAWHLEDLGGQQVLKGFRCCLAHSSMRELIPQNDRSWEEASLVVGV